MRHKWQIVFVVIGFLLSLAACRTTASVGWEREVAFWNQPDEKIRKEFQEFADEKIADRYGDEMANNVSDGDAQVPLSVYNDFLFTHSRTASAIIWGILGWALAGMILWGIYEVIRRWTKTPPLFS